VLIGFKGDVKMDAFERLKASMVRVGSLVDFYQHSPFVILHGIDAAGRDVLDTTTNVTVEDLERLLDGLADRDISLKHSKPTEIEIEMAKQSDSDRGIWVRGYDEGYKAGRDGELKKIKERLNFILGQI
jgi:polyphosphate kinase 2 (PPK2 family)